MIVALAEWVRGWSLTVRVLTSAAAIFVAGVGAGTAANTITDHPVERAISARLDTTQVRQARLGTRVDQLQLNLSILQAGLDKQRVLLEEQICLSLADYQHTNWRACLLKQTEAP